MHDYSIKKIAWQIFNKEKWWDVLSKFIYVLRMNIFIVDKYGYVILPPDETKFGGRFYTERTLGAKLLHNVDDPIAHFTKHGNFYEYVDRFDLHVFAIPVIIQQDQLVAYMMVGPVAVAKKMTNEQYRDMAANVGVDADVLLECIYEIRTVSHLMMNSILELLSEIIKDNIELNSKIQDLDKMKGEKNDPFVQEFKDFAKDIYSTVRLDELLITLLDIALSMTNTECGSIMVIDEVSAEMSIKAARGLDSTVISSSRVKIGESVAGIAFRENKEFIINGTPIHDDLSPHLSRPEIRNALVMPLTSKDKVFGVLNLHTKTSGDTIRENLDNLRHLTKLLASAF
ncbi:MAG: PocR ligand-binding domain-containing protein [Candidatus Omnitrophica bacterium]|nr:PocR ligand-binding domain-containing protein [Candidatus Omnitrophota bacterium]MCB9747006.1 PocR ligand-binding domain-containing protein [Candidatus Omnitrophota bacterium]